MKKALWWILGILLSPLLLFVILATLLYIPPIQNWAVQKATAIASEATGWQVEVDHVSLSFPLDLGIDGVRVIQAPDTIASIGYTAVDVSLWPLLGGRVVVNELELRQTRLNTLDLIPDLQVSGKAGRLALYSRGIDLGEGTAEIHGALIEEADLTVALSDTAAVDTTESAPLPWRIDIADAGIRNTRLALHTPGDTMLVTAYMGEATARETVVDLLAGRYTVKSLELRDGEITYDLPLEPPADSDGMDFNHLALSGINIAVDSIFFQSPQLMLNIRETALREKSGLCVTRLCGQVLMDSVSLRLPSMTLQTPHSDIRAKANVPFSVMDSVAPAPLQLVMTASVGKSDIMYFALPNLRDMLSPRQMEHFSNQWPDEPLTLTAHIDGNMQQANVRQLELSLPGVARAMASGTMANLTDTEALTAQLDIQAESGQLTGLLTPFAPELTRNYRIPAGIALNGSVKADGPRYAANITATQGQGMLRFNANYDTRAEYYVADVKADRLNLHAFMPNDSLYGLTASVKLKGRGTDFTSNRTWLDADATIGHLQYGQMALDDISMAAHLKNGKALADISGCNKLFEGTIGLQAAIESQRIGRGKRQHHLDVRVEPDIDMLDLFALGIADDPLVVGVRGAMTLESDLQQFHKLRGLLGNIYLRDSLETYRPENFGIFAQTQSDSTWLRLQSGDFIVKVDASGGYEQLLSQLSNLTDSLMDQYRRNVIDQPAIKRMLPTMKVYATSGRSNPVSSLMKATANTHFKTMRIDLDMSAEKGINGEAYIHGLNVDSTRIDTISMRLKDNGKRLTFNGRVCNNRRNPQFIFTALFDGSINEHGGTVGVRYFDSQGRMGVRIGATAAMVNEGLRINLLPSNPTIGYKVFSLNKDNFVLLNENTKIDAKVDLIADDGTGVKLYTENQDSTLLQDITVSLNRFDLGEITSVVPYMPRITGLLNGDYHLTMNDKQQISVASDMQVSDMTYEGSRMGNIEAELAYLQREDNTHAVEATLLRDSKEIGSLQGEYRDEGTGYLDASLQLTRFPLEMGNGFMPNGLMGFDGYAEGQLSVKGILDKPVVNGMLQVDSAYLFSLPYGVRLRIDNTPITFTESKLVLDRFSLYAYNDNPLTISGNIDFHDLDRMTMSMRMRATNFQLIKAKQTKESIAFGKAYVNFLAGMTGRMDQLRMRGRLDVLGTTDMTYLLLDSPLSTDNQLDELVKFTDFTDSTQTVVHKPTPDGMTMSMTINIDQGAHVRCGLNADQTNYVDLYGGGEMNMKYAGGDITMTGRYTLTNGQMKYSLPVIPLKTFTIQDGSYVEFNGDPMNPTLNLTATERTKANVSQDENQSRTVLFDCGVVITQTLSNMGLEFVIDAPEDMSISNELNAMTADQRGKMAVTMLTTGMYLSDGNTGGFSMNSALSSFLQSEINSITGNALKTLDLSIGMDNSTDASGATRTDYSFKFAKRFWNNRLNVQIGGKVSSGDEAAQGGGQNQSFFDNVTMEYRLTPTSNQYVKLFYNQNVYDWLEGYTGEYGGGYIWKRRLDSFWDIFKIWGKSNNTLMPTAMPTTVRSNLTTKPQPADTVAAPRPLQQQNTKTTQE